LGDSDAPVYDRFWPFSEVFNFPKQAVQAAAIGKSSR